MLTVLFYLYNNPLLSGKHACLLRGISKTDAPLRVMAFYVLSSLVLCVVRHYIVKHPITQHHSTPHSKNPQSTTPHHPIRHHSMPPTTAPTHTLGWAPIPNPLLCHNSVLLSMAPAHLMPPTFQKTKHGKDWLQSKVNKFETSL